MRSTQVMPSTIAIDGPAASGKSTIGYHLAKRLTYLYLDTGVLYRAVTWAVLAQEMVLEDEARISHLAEELEIEVLGPTEDDGRQYTILVKGQDVTWELRTPAVDRTVSPVSAYPGVRQALTRRMREIAARGDVVMVGRDIGTVVIPDADLKVFVIASAKERARRRHRELLAKGKQLPYAEVLQDIRRRDRIDSSRAAAPLKPAADAIIFDNTHLSIDQMHAEIEKLVLHCGCLEKGG